MAGTSGSGVVKRPSGKRPLDAEQVKREMLWRSWFPRVPFNPVKVTPTEDVDKLLAAFEAFCQGTFTVKVPGIGSVPLKLYDSQRETVRGWLTHRYTVVLKARQIGFSTISSAFSLWLTLGYPDRQVIILSQGEREARKLLAKSRYAYRKMPDWVVERGPRLLNRTLETMIFENDSSIESYPSGPNAGRGESAFLVIVDEWASIPNQEEAWSAVEPITDIGGRVIGLSTAKGEGNFFHRLWEGSQNGTNTFHGMFFPWWSVPGRDQEWYEDKQKNLEPWQLYQEYPATAEEAFIGSGNPFFDVELLMHMQVIDPIGVYDIELVPHTHRWKLSDGKNLRMWKKPDSGLSYVIGADIAQGLDYGDWTVAWIMEANTGSVVACWRGKIDPNDFGESVLPALGYFYNHALVCPEINNHGYTVVTALKRVKYQRIYRRRTRAKRQDHAMETVGFLTSKATKPELMDEVSRWLREHNMPDRQTLDELKTFVREQRGNSVVLHGSPWDDCVMSLGLTCEARKYALKNGFVKAKPDMVPGSIAWWEKELKSKSKNLRSKVRASL